MIESASEINNNKWRNTTRSESLGSSDRFKFLQEFRRSFGTDSDSILGTGAAGTRGESSDSAGSRGDVIFNRHSL